MSPAKPRKQSFEASLKRLEAIVESLEQGNVSLDNATELYEEGIQLAKECAEKLKAAELKVRKLTKAVDGQFEIEGLKEE
jgi:exodeoxyribonuclease VII small subunit